MRSKIAFIQTTILSLYKLFSVIIPIELQMRDSRYSLAFLIYRSHLQRMLKCLDPLRKLLALLSSLGGQTGNTKSLLKEIQCIDQEFKNQI